MAIASRSGRREAGPEFQQSSGPGKPVRLNKPKQSKRPLNSDYDIRREKKRRQRRVRLAVLFVGLVLLAGSLYSAVNYALSYLAKPDMMKTMAWEHSVSGQAWSFQRELTTFTDQRGMLIPMVNEGERVSKGLEIARLNYLGEGNLYEESNRRLYSPVAGIVSYEPDGLEIISTKRDYSELTISLLEEKITSLPLPDKDSQGLAGLLQNKMDEESAASGGDRSGTAASGAEGADSSDSSGAGAADGTGGIAVASGSGGAGQDAGGIMAGPFGQPGPGQTAQAPKTSPKEVAGGAVIMKITDNLSDCYVYIRLPRRETAALGEATVEGTSHAAGHLKEVSHRAVHLEGTPVAEMPPGEVPLGEAPSGETALEGADIEGAALDGAPLDGVALDGAPPEEAPFDAAPLKEADLVTVRLEGAGEGKATVLKCEEISDGWGVLLKLETGLEALRHARQHELTLVLGTEERVVVNNGAVITKEGRQGIYVVEKSQVRFKPVNVIEERDGLQVIEAAESGELKAEETVITRPWLVWEGMRMRG